MTHRKICLNFREQQSIFAYYIYLYLLASTKSDLRQWNKDILQCWNALPHIQTLTHKVRWGMWMILRAWVHGDLLLVWELGSIAATNLLVFPIFFFSFLIILLLLLGYKIGKQIWTQKHKHKVKDFFEGMQWETMTNGINITTTLNTFHCSLLLFKNLIIAWNS